MITERDIREALKILGEYLGFETFEEIHVGHGSCADLGWFLKGTSKLLKTENEHVDLETHFAAPVAIFEIEWATYENAKHVKGSRVNIETANPLFGVIIFKGHDCKNENEFKNRKERILKYIMGTKCRIMVLSDVEILRTCQELGILDKINPDLDSVVKDLCKKLLEQKEERRKWNEKSFFEDANQHLDGSQIKILRKLYEFCKNNNLLTSKDWGTGKYKGSFNPKLAGKKVNLNVYSDGTLWINIDPSFQEFVDALRGIKGFKDFIPSRVRSREWYKIEFEVWAKEVDEFINLLKKYLTNSKQGYNK